MSAASRDIFSVVEFTKFAVNANGLISIVTLDPEAYIRSPWRTKAPETGIQSPSLNVDQVFQLSKTGSASRRIGKGDSTRGPRRRTHRGTAEEAAHAAPVPPGPAVADTLFPTMNGEAAGPANMEGVELFEAGEAECR